MLGNIVHYILFLLWHDHGFRYDVVVEMFLTIFSCDKTDLLLSLLVPISEMDYVQSSFQFTFDVIRLQMDLQQYICLRTCITKMSMYDICVCVCYMHAHTLTFQVNVLVE
jgi:hypothetical protein